ncbi:MAG: threonine/serine exporter family protein [Mycobacterium sp.]
MSDSRAARALRTFRKSVPDPIGAPDTHDRADIAAMLRELGIALVEVELPTNQIATRLRRIGARYTTEKVSVVVLPTVLLIQIGTEASEVDVTNRTTTQLNLAGKIDAIAELAEAGAISPVEAVAAVAAARRTKPRFGPVTTVIGYAITTLGFGLVLNPTWASLWGYVFLGTVVGIIVVAAQPFPSLRPVVPPLSALVVTLLATWFVADAANDGLLRVITPALVAVLPGIALTIGAMELANSAIIAGASRVVFGVTQLGLMVFGLAMGLHIAGPLAPQHPSPQMGPWSLYVAIVVIGVGLYIYLSGPPGTLIWVMSAVAVALLGQQLGGLFLSSAHSAAVGAFLVVPFVMVVRHVRGAPPGIVLMLVAFWTLVPGALGFESLSEVAAGVDVNITTLGVTVAAIFSITLGTLIGWSVFHAQIRRTAVQ